MLMGCGEWKGGLEIGREKGGRGVMCRFGGRTEAVCAVCLAYLWTICGATMRVARSDSLSVSCMMMRRFLQNNQISSVEAGAFAGLGNLTTL